MWKSRNRRNLGKFWKAWTVGKEGKARKLGNVWKVEQVGCVGKAGNVGKVINYKQYHKYKKKYKNRGKYEKVGKVGFFCCWQSRVFLEFSQNFFRTVRVLHCLPWLCYFMYFQQTCDLTAP